MKMVRGWLAILAFALVGGGGATAVAQSLDPYTPLDAGQDAWLRGEDYRRAAVNQQLYWNDQLRLRPYAGYPAAAWPYYGRDEAYGYGYAYNRPYGWPLWRDRVLATAPGPVFEPWPFVPGDLYGPGIGAPPVRQPIGQRQIQTGPNRWESHPVYADDLRDEAAAFESRPGAVRPSVKTFRREARDVREY